MVYFLKFFGHAVLLLILIDNYLQIRIINVIKIIYNLFTTFSVLGNTYLQRPRWQSGLGISLQTRDISALWVVLRLTASETGSVSLP